MSVAPRGVAHRKSYFDERGRQLATGVRVAFNYSGNVAIGTIEHITPGGEFHIRRETHLHGNTLSKVKNKHSIIAICEVEDVEKVYRDLRSQALEDFGTAKKTLIKRIKDAWDLDDVYLSMEEMFGEDWRDALD